MWQHFFKDYFHFTKKERSGILILLAVVIVLILLPLVYPYFLETETYDHREFEQEIARLKIDSSSKSNFKNYDSDYYNDYSLPDKKYLAKAEVFLFDPNTASESDWIRLGVKEKTAKTILKYISKGGKFYQPEDIKKIWGLRPSDVERLLPYVSIKSERKEYLKYEEKDHPKNTFFEKTIHKIDINLADTSTFIAFPGIGSKLSQRIIAFREKLGGFYSIEQVGETYFLPDSTFQKIKPYLVLNNSGIKRININNASVDEMKSHPYIKYNLANAIFQYRNQHGNFSSVESLKKIMIVTEEVFTKVAPYLTVE
jgi:competence protein ComEA